MLEQRDLDILRGMMESVMDTRLTSAKEEILEVMDRRLAETEERILGKVDVRLAETEERILGKVDMRLSETKEEILEVMDERLTSSENLVLEEVGRTRNILEDKVNKVQQNMDEISQYYRITKLENDNTALVLKSVQELTKRVEALEQKIA